MPEIILKPGREKSVRQHHPWIFSGAIGHESEPPERGGIVHVLDSKGSFLAYGYYNSRSQIRIRILDWHKNAVLGRAWWHEKLKAAIVRRAHMLEGPRTNSCRLVYGESDFLPGLIVDKYADYIVIQILTAGIERVRETIVTELFDLLKPKGIYERSDTETRALEGLKIRTGMVAGDDPPDEIIIKENNRKFKVNIITGQKSGYYLDQRDNRQVVASYAKGLNILDCFCYSGGFSVYALGGFAKSATLLDSSAQSLALARENITINDFSESQVAAIEGDVFKVLREFRDSHRLYDMVILDPPKFAPTKADLKKALAGYKDINMLGMNVLNPGGILATFSCSGAVDLQTLQTVLFWAATDTGRDVQILRTLSQGEDHPRLATFPESEYLKGLICRVV
jgi:23S rRNA (cytosine1962-C5)-methyltransferase